MDTIEIRGLQVATRIGVPEAERERWQTLALDLTLTPKVSFSEADDDLAKTVDYEAVCLKLRDWAASNDRQLYESPPASAAMGALVPFNGCLTG